MDPSIVAALISAIASVVAAVITVRAGRREPAPARIADVVSAPISRGDLASAIPPSKAFRRALYWFVYPMTGLYVVAAFGSIVSLASDQSDDTGALSANIVVACAFIAIAYAMRRRIKRAAE